MQHSLIFICRSHKCPSAYSLCYLLFQLGTGGRTQTRKYSFKEWMVEVACSVVEDPEDQAKWLD